MRFCPFTDTLVQIFALGQIFDLKIPLSWALTSCLNRLTQRESMSESREHDEFRHLCNSSKTERTKSVTIRIKLEPLMSANMSRSQTYRCGRQRSPIWTFILLGKFVCAWTVCVCFFSTPLCVNVCPCKCVFVLASADAHRHIPEEAVILKLRSYCERFACYVRQ